MTKPHLALVTPTTEIRTVARRSTPRRPTNAALRTREHLAQHEVEKLIEVVKRNRHGRRDALHDLFSLPAWAARRRGGRPALGAGRLQDGDAARAEGEERHAGQSSPDRPGNA